MNLILLVCIFLSVYSAFYLLLSYIIDNPRRRLKRRIEVHMLDGTNIFKKPLFIRVSQPIVQWTGKQLEKYTPEKYKRHLESILLNLGYRYTIQDVLLVKVVSVLFTALLAILFFVLVSSIHPLVPIFFCLIVFIIPDFILSKGLKKKRKNMLIELPSFIEQLAVVLESGISFDNAIIKIAKRRKGNLINEFHLFVQELRMGSSREEALKKMATRVQLTEFDSLVRALIQGDKMGIGILETIKIQADQLRIKQTQRYQEQAMKIPIKLLFPLVIFIFPPILIIILGPALIHIINTLF